jgi:transketolase
MTLNTKLRLKLLDLYYKVNAGHIGCSLSCIDLMIASLIEEKIEEDTFLLSKGHAAAALYVCLNELGEISDEVLATYYQNGTTLPAHPAPNQHKGIPFATGSLGHGLPIGLGIAHANKLLKNHARVFVLMSDGETNEGTTWEAAHFAAQQQADNLIVMIDKNRIQGFGYTQDVFGDTADPRKWELMGFEVVECDGHDIPALRQCIRQLSASKNGKPKCIVANTIKGKGVSYMENTVDWHYLPMNEAQYLQAKQEIDNHIVT